MLARFLLGQNMTDKESIIDKLRKLLALGDTSRGATEAEAQAAMAKAHELLAAHNLTMADIEAPGGKIEEVIQDEISTTMKDSWRDIVWTAVGKTFFCFVAKYVGTKRMAIIGRPADVAATKMMAKYLTETAERLAAASSEDVRFKNAYRLGFAHRIAKRCYEIVQERTSANTPGSKELVPLYSARESEIKEFINEKIPNSYVTQGTNKASHSSYAGYAAGDSAAASIPLTRDVIDGTVERKALR